MKKVILPAREIIPVEHGATTRSLEARAQEEKDRQNSTEYPYGFFSQEYPLMDLCAYLLAIHQERPEPDYGWYHVPPILIIPAPPEIRLDRPGGTGNYLALDGNHRTNAARAHNITIPCMTIETEHDLAILRPLKLPLLFAEASLLDITNRLWTLAREKYAPPAHNSFIDYLKRLNMHR
ncbi:hypothetical protein C4580_04320 [Candidatus Woesearchaeota archaeon]|nr:MAG: hypothetical protein C4580_04320 [Candidatus Woesearchaeota archaeon]